MNQSFLTYIYLSAIAKILQLKSLLLRYDFDNIFEMIEGFITTKEAAQILNVSEGRIRQLVADGRLPAIKVGQTNLVKESDLELVRERKRTGRPKKES